VNISDISIKNPVFAWMLMIGLVVFGAMGFKGMGVSQLPDVDFPVLSVSVTWEGAAPEVMETEIADVLEDALISIQGLREVSSTSRQGSVSLNLEFDLSKDIDVALQEVQSKIAQAQRRLPRDAGCPERWILLSSINPTPKTNPSYGWHCRATNPSGRSWNTPETT
jgi:multidrug efflux pump subunit AcrB